MPASDPDPRRGVSFRRRAARRLRVDVCDALGRTARAPGLAGWLARVAPGTAHGSVTVVLVSDRRMRAINRRWRGVDAPTDVLSFPAGEPLPGARGRAERHLGDLVIASGKASSQARAAGHSVSAELRVLALHGLLHLLGYDHDRDRGEMARMERRLRRKGGLREGLIERAPRLEPPARPRRGPRGPRPR